MRFVEYTFHKVRIIVDVSVLHGSVPGARLSGMAIRRLMRRHKKTIRGLAQAHQLSMKRVREVRAHGVCGFSALEWVWIITGKWPDRHEPTPT